MRKVKPLSEYQKSIYGEVLKEFFNPIFSTSKDKSLKNNDLSLNLIDDSAISLPPEKSATKNFREASPKKTNPISERKSDQSVPTEQYSTQNEGEIDGDPQPDVQNLRISRPIFDSMEIPELPYTIPRLIKGRAITKIPVGTTLEKEIAKQRWYIEFFFHNAETERMERIRVTRNLNRIKDPKEKLRNFNHLCEAYHIALQGGWNPLDENANARLKKEIIGINLDESLGLFDSYHKAKGTRPKSMSTYRSTINAFIKFYGGNRKVSTISDYDITDFLNTKEREELTSIL